MKTLRIRVCLFMCFLISISVFSQEAEGNAAQANNPLANMTALNFHDYYMPKLSNAPDDAYMNTAWVRFAKTAFWREIITKSIHSYKYYWITRSKWKCKNIKWFRRYECIYVL